MGFGTGEADWSKGRTRFDGLMSFYVVCSLPLFGLRVKLVILCGDWMACAIIACAKDIGLIRFDTVR